MNTCLNCQRLTKNPKFCSLKCSAKYQFRNSNKNLPSCKKCLKPVKYYQSKYCSRECYALSREKTGPRKDYGKCLNCNKKLSYRQKKFCSNKCQGQFKLRKANKLGSESILGQQTLRKYLLRTRENKCNICQLYKWNEQLIHLEVDHIDGNYTNNKEENLRLICPNCAALLPTFKARNKGNGRYCRRQRYANGQSY